MDQPGKCRMDVMSGHVDGEPMVRLTWVPEEGEGGQIDMSVEDALGLVVGLVQAAKEAPRRAEAARRANVR